MSFVCVAPDVVAAAARDLARIRPVIGAAYAAGQSTSVIVAAAGAEVPAAMAALSVSNRRRYQQPVAQAAASRVQSVAGLSAVSAAHRARPAALAEGTEVAAPMDEPRLPLGRVGATRPSVVAKKNLIRIQSDGTYTCRLS